MAGPYYSTTEGLRLALLDSWIKGNKGSKQLALERARKAGIDLFTPSYSTPTNPTGKYKGTNLPDGDFNFSIGNVIGIGVVLFLVKIVIDIFK